MGTWSVTIYAANNTSRHVHLHRRDRYFDRELYKKRMRLTIVPFLCFANQQAALRGVMVSTPA